MPKIADVLASSLLSDDPDGLHRSSAWVSSTATSLPVPPDDIKQVELYYYNRKTFSRPPETLNEQLARRQTLELLREGIREGSVVEGDVRITFTVDEGVSLPPDFQWPE